MAAKVIIGIDPHKTTHTAVAVDDKETRLAELEVRANTSQLKRLLGPDGSSRSSTSATSAASTSS